MLMALLVAVSASSSWAAIETYLPGGANIELKFTNYDEGTIYHNLAVGTYGKAFIDALPTSDPGGGLPWKTPPIGAAPGEDTWGIFKLTDILNLDNAATLWQEGDGGFEITGIFWGEDDASVSWDGTTQTITGNDLQYAFFEDPLANLTPFSFAAGPTGRVPGVPPIYAGSTDGTLIWTGNSVPGIAGISPDEFGAQYTPGSPTPPPFDKGVGDFLGNLGTNDWGTGSLNDLLDAGDIDMTFHFTASGSFAGDFLLRSNDPVTAQVTPELGTAPLMLLGMLPIGVAWWRRRKA
jgi:hypothetical protein